jgi:hypothetical protein
MAHFGLIGPSYTSESVDADCQRTVNLYVESIESGQGKSAAALYPVPGLSTFATGADRPVRGFIEINNRVFVVVGAIFYEMMSNGTLTARGNIINDGTLVSMAASPIQILIASGGAAYVFDAVANTLVQLSPALFAASVSFVGFMDGFFIALLAGTNEFQLSTPEDATDWDLTVITAVSVFSDNVLAMLVDHRQLWLWGPHEFVVYFDSGAQFFPFEVIPGGFGETGILAPESPVQLDNSVLWLGGDIRGGAIAYKAAGYTPLRISNHAVEREWQTYTTTADVRCYSYQEAGHSFDVFYFPTAQKTWVFDVATGMWHERDHFDPTTARSTAHRSQCHIFAFEKHFVGDWNSGNIYQMSIDILTDNGGPIKRVRRAPHISQENEWTFFPMLTLDLEVGLGPQPPLLDGLGNPRDPQITLRMSRDGAKTFGSERIRNCGQAGKYKKRVIWRRLGKARDMVFELSMTDPIPWRLLEAYLPPPSERLGKKYTNAL